MNTPEQIAKDYDLMNLAYCCIPDTDGRYDYHLLFSYNGQIYREAISRSEPPASSNVIFYNMLKRSISANKIPLSKHKIVLDIITDL